MRNAWLAKLTLIALFAVVAPYQAAHAAEHKKDDVFIDEGDGDFDSMPVPTSTSSLKPAPEMHEAAAPAPVDVPEAAPVKEAAPETAQIPAPAPAVLPDAPPQDVEAAAPVEAAPVQAAAPAPGAPAAVDQPAAQEEAAAPAPEKHGKKSHEKKAVAHHEAKPEHKHAAVAASGGKLAKGFYAVTQSPCPMTRAPASDSEKMITVKASKKIWVEKVDSNWVRAFNKAGEPGYIQSECVEFQ